MVATQSFITELSESQKAVLQKYLIEDEVSWEDVVHRVATYVASAESTPEQQSYWQEKFLSILQPMKFVPGGSILANCNHGTRGLLNCFVLSAEDHIHDITKLVSDSVLTTKFRGGVGINIGAEGSKGYIRQKGAPFQDGKALGPCAVLDMVSENSKKITTGNKARRGAFLFSMNWKHPDIWEFIQAKTQSTIDANFAKSMIEQLAQLAQQDEPSQEKQEKLKALHTEVGTAWVETHLNPEGKRDRRWHNANISVQLDDEFFAKLDQGDEEANKLWQAMAENAHATADPGLLLIDNAKRRSPIRDFVTCTNPCGEIFLPPNSACNLGSLVLTKFVRRTAESNIEIDWDDLAETVRIAIRFLDNVLDVSEFATPDQKHNVRDVFRQLGLGIMGWADYLKLARIPYDSARHLEEIDRWGSWIADHAYRTSEAIAAEKGACGVWDQIKDLQTGNPFERWMDSEGNYYNGTEAHHNDRQDLTQVPRRNSTVLSIAPTGSIAQLAACSWAFEPDFGLTLWKQVFVDASRSQQNWVQILNPYLDELNLPEADAEIVKQTGSLADTNYGKQHPDIARSFKIAREIPPGWHILVQSKWQSWIDSSISKTINLPAHATVDEIKQIYRLAEKAGLKGVTIYRSGTLDSEPIKVGNSEKDS
ncbi:adenosylcobalamin-dependent ribonucleoside-diphosphate reductase [Acaryochloris sp. CCMEE 5410]|uniref:adenosylcobalamin-dependent ribonucleoside-diphosphate reductase n=1 Tax=Acaryochloris sp. CCMEE 5410 TaxID=310037 RepID=UPI0002483D54|nr:adenosylcobalamin-dependent ribonucleoside-diphosphate reductase [Acaryochloris sp. CCMEE 5410]KAI9134135.1 adenosylcobalamin-dependent ribonucleoside-diphosphate reductase [Acaryochloris sp. CCMEE 5410]